MSVGQGKSSAELAEALQVTLLARLVLDSGADEHSVTDWDGLLAGAERDRLVGLIWGRAGDVIRRSAPPDVVSRWRKRALGIELRTEGQFSLLVEVLTALRGHGLSPVAVKGAPLSALLYGDIVWRPSGDIDLLLPSGEREEAARVLATLGWSSTSGEAPSEETFELLRNGHLNVLELHSSLLDDPLLAHLTIPVEVTTTVVRGHPIPAFGGDLLAPYLAVHLAKHDSPPLLWFVDFHQLWSKLGERERAAARSAARTCGVERHLQWAVRASEHLERAAQGSIESGFALAKAQERLGDLKRLLRLLKLAAGLRDCARTMRGRLFPPGPRAHWRDAIRVFASRGAGWLYRHWQWLDRSVQAGAEAQPALSVDEHDFATLLGDALGRGFAIWIRVRGESMRPAIPSMAAVRIVPLAGRLPRKGEVVLARLPTGRFVLHRVVRLSDNSIQLKGDALARRDVNVASEAVLGLCDQVEIEGSICHVADRPRDALQLLASTLWSRTRAVVMPRAR